MSLALDTVAGLDSIAAKHGQRGRAQWATIRTMHARALLEAHDTVLRAYYDAVYASHTQVTQHRHHVTANVYV
jgi:hypothetical protein